MDPWKVTEATIILFLFPSTSRSLIRNRRFTEESLYIENIANNIYNSFFQSKYVLFVDYLNNDIIDEFLKNNIFCVFGSVQ